MSEGKTEKFDLKIKEHILNPESKKLYNQEHFTESAPRYDFATKALSLWQDASWKHLLIKLLPNQDAPKSLDLACGTGDVTFELAKRYPTADITGIDITEAMLKIAKKRNQYSNITFKNADIGDLPYEDASFQLVTGSYALRNAPNISKAVVEIHRILESGGIFAFLDFSKPEHKFLELSQYYLLKLWGGLWGLILHGNPEVHGYISASLREYPAPSKLNKTLTDAGFKFIENKKIFSGMLSIIILEKE